MSDKILLSTAYLPPVEYFSLISEAEEAIIETEENYPKQSYRNRCFVLSSYGPQILTVPVHGTRHKTILRDVRIDYSKRWQQVHLGAIKAAYGSSPFFQFYFEDFEKIILDKYELLLDLNTELMLRAMKILNTNTRISFSGKFIPDEKSGNDFRYKLSPKKESLFVQKQYSQVFPEKGFIPRMSVLDLIFNMGPDSPDYL